MKRGCKIILGIMLLSLFPWVNLSVIKAEGNHLLISEVYYDTIGDDNIEEWIEIYNPTPNSIDLSNYKIGDEETQGGSEGMFQFPAGSFIASLDQKVIAKSAGGFYNLYQKYPDFEMTPTDDEISDFSQTMDMSKFSSWGTGSLSLTNTGDEILLLDNSDNVIDAVVFENGVFDNTTKHSGVNVGHSISRNPIGQDNNDCQIDFTDEILPHPGYLGIYEGGDYFSSLGTIKNDNTASLGNYLSAEIDQTTSGYLFYGPYADQQPTGMYQALFRLKTDNNMIDAPVVRIEINNNGGNGIWEYREIKGTDFVSANNWQDFNLWWERTNEGSMEYRVWFYDNTNIGFDNVRVGKVDRLIYEAENLRHNLGTETIDATASQGRAWAADISSFNNHMIFGPYNDLKPGSYEIRFVAKIEDNSSTNKIITLDTNTYPLSDSSRTKDIVANDFHENNKYQAFSLWLARNAESSRVEYRIFYSGNANIVVDNIIICQKDRIRYEAEDLAGFSNNITNDSTAGSGMIRAASVTDNSEGWMQFGPYSNEQTEGNYRAIFRLKTSNITGELPIAKIDIYNSGGSGPEAGREIYPTDFANINTWQEFTSDFIRTNDGTLEYRVYFYDLSDVAVDWVEVERI